MRLEYDTTIDDARRVLRRMVYSPLRRRNRSNRRWRNNANTPHAM